MRAGSLTIYEGPVARGRVPHGIKDRDEVKSGEPRRSGRRNRGREDPEDAPLVVPHRAARYRSLGSPSPSSPLFLFPHGHKYSIVNHAELKRHSARYFLNTSSKRTPPSTMSISSIDKFTRRRTVTLWPYNLGFPDLTAARRSTWHPFNDTKGKKIII